jgi:Na+/proline symporter
MSLAILFFIIYITVVVIIGIISSKKETEDDFMIADRKVAGVQVTATMSAGF